MKRKLLITIVSILIVTAFFLLPKNRVWFNERIIGYWNDFRQQKDKLDLEQRKVTRWGTSYTVSKQIAGLFSNPQQAKEALVLLPPTGYFKDRNIDYHVPEPAVFYYYTGLKTTWTNSKVALEANWMVTAANGRLHIIPVNDKKALADTIASLKKYPVSL